MNLRSSDLSRGRVAAELREAPCLNICVARCAAFQYDALSHQSLADSTKTFAHHARLAAVVPPQARRSAAEHERSRSAAPSQRSLFRTRTFGIVAATTQDERRVVRQMSALAHAKLGRLNRYRTD
eukprot:1049074-Prymnesium_polylepis.1